MPLTTAPKILPLAASGRGSAEFWQNQITASVSALERDLPGWQKNLDQYLAKIFEIGTNQDRIVVPKDYSKVERKKASIAFNLPHVTLRPRQMEIQDATHIFQSRVNDQLGLDGIDAMTMVDEVIFDVLCPSGFGVCKIGYEPYQDGEVQVQVGTQPGPAVPISPGAVLGLSAPPPPEVPVYASAPNIVYEKYFMERVSPAKFLKPVSFVGKDFDKAPWLAVEYRLPREVAMAAWNLAEEDCPPCGEDTHLLITRPSDEAGEDECLVRELWYYAYLFDPTVKHPLKMRKLVFLDGREAPVEHRDSPYQRFENGKFLVGMVGNPIHVLTIRTLADSSSPRSDVAASRPQVLELSTGRTQMIQQRDRSRPMRMADVDRLGGPAAFQKVLDNQNQAIIPVQGMDASNPPIQEVARASYPREDFTFDSIINRDIDEAWGMGANQQGLESSESKTATEQALVERNANARMDKERQLVLQWFAKGVGKFAALLQLFDDREELVEVLGAQSEKTLQQWDRQKVQGRWAFEIRPDAGQRIDGEMYRKNLIDAFNYLARDPHINRMEILRPIVESLNLDPTRVIMPKLPEKGPDPANVSFRFSGEDLDPTLPRFAIIKPLLDQSGYKIPEAAIAQAKAHAAQQAEIMNMAGLISGRPVPTTPGEQREPTMADRAHPGMAEKFGAMNEHQGDETGRLPNAPEPAGALGGARGPM